MNTTELLTPEIAETLNKRCHCVSVDMDDLRKAVSDDCASGAPGIDLLHDRPHLFAAPPVFLARSQVAKMQALIAAIETVVALPAYRETVLAWAPEIARHDPRARGVFLGYDFHLAPLGPQLIEINTNAGGAMLNAALLRAARACCVEVQALTPATDSVEGLGREFIRMFEAEWRLQRGDEALQTIVIVDESPETQYLYPEFLLFQDLFNRAGYRAVIVSPGALEYRDKKLFADNLPVDLVYNRLTDFDLATPASSALRAAYLDNAVVVTPHPRAHALYADKRNLALLSDSDVLRELGVDENSIAILSAGIPRTEIVVKENAARLWSERKKLFFKPMRGFGSRGAYRGDKLTKRAWEDILAGDYIAQAYMPPSERVTGDPGAPIALKADFRSYVYDGEMQLVAARLYQGQTTNFRTPGGGFAPVFSPQAPAKTTAITTTVQEIAQ
ncbi:MAG TPA: hypothetical protein VF275_08280 [Gammaproteobacteria bacterium]